MASRDHALTEPFQAETERLRVSFNVNQTVFVKLNPEGVAILRREHEAIFRDLPLRRQFVEPVPDADGWVGFQLWEFMQSFGPHIRMGFSSPFETQIEFEVPPSSAKPVAGRGPGTTSKIPLQQKEQ